MSWSGTVDDAHKIPERKRLVKVYMQLTTTKKVMGTSGTLEERLMPIGVMTRRDTVTTEKWVGIQGTTAFNYVDSEGTGAGVEDLVAERMNDAGAYAIIKDTIVEGTWA
jgi:hypothetical protein